MSNLIGGNTMKSIGEFTESIRPINYNGKEIDRGWILGKRKYRWTLKKKYEPCWAKNGHFVSELSPHKKDFIVYIPLSELKKGGKLTIVNRTTKVNVNILEVNQSFVRYEVNHIIEDKPKYIKSTDQNQQVPF